MIILVTGHHQIDASMRNLRRAKRTNLLLEYRKDYVYRCPHCGDVSSIKEWGKWHDLPCDDCPNGHHATDCPKCSTPFDMILNDIHDIQEEIVKEREIHV